MQRVIPDLKAWSRVASFGCNEFNNEPKDLERRSVGFPLLDAKEAFEASFVQTIKNGSSLPLSPHRGLGGPVAAHVLTSACETPGDALGMEAPWSGQVLLCPRSGIFTWCFGEWVKTHSWRAVGRL